MSWRLRGMAFGVLSSLLAASVVVAEPPHVSYIFPAGGQQGTTVEFKVGGHYLHEGCPFEMWGDGVAASNRIERTETVWFEGPLIPQPASQRKEDYPKDYLGTVRIAENAPLGNRYWRVTTSQGITSRMKFVVGDLPEIVEEEIDGDPIPKQVELPVTINGRIFPREDIDIWTFEASQGERISCEVNAARLGSSLDSRLEIRTPDGNVLTENVDAFGTDSFVQFVAPIAGQYECRIHDMEFGGLQHYVYRLSIRRGPYIRSFYPLGGRRGESVRLSLHGDGFSTTAVDVPIPDDATDQLQLNLPGIEANPIQLAASSSVEILEAEPNSEPVTLRESKSITGDCVLNGRIQSPGDIDLWRISAEPGQVLKFEVHAARLGSPLDSILSIISADGRQASSNDDVTGGTPDSRLIWKVPESGGDWYLQIKDQFENRGDNSYAYRISVTEALPTDFSLQLPSDVLNVDRGGESKFKVTIDRTLGFKGDVELSVEGLPEGVTAENVKLAKSRRDAQIIIKAGEDSAPGVTQVQVIGTAIDGDQTIRREAVYGFHAGTVRVSHLDLAVAIPTPFKFHAPFETRYASRGTTYTRHYFIDRNDFEGPIEIEPADRQVRHLQGVTGPRIVVPAGESEFDYTVTLPPWMEIGRTSRFCLMASAFVGDSDGNRHRVSFTSHAQDDQIIVLVDPVRLSIQTPSRTFTVRPGSETTVPVQIRRGTNVVGPVRIDVKSARHLKGWKADPVTIASGDSEASLKLAIDANLEATFNAPLTIIASAFDTGMKPVTAEHPIRIELEGSITGHIDTRFR